jgi:acylphosphatase
MTETARRIVFVGRVQGVGFRFTAFNRANRYGLTGQVRNMPDGSVEMIAQGSADDIADCVRDIKESFRDYITQTKIEEIAPQSEYKDFKITF